MWRTAYTTFLNLFTAFSSYCDNINQLVSFIAIKSTKQESVSEWVGELVTSITNQWSDSGPITSVLVELNLRVIIDESKTSVCVGPTLVCRFNRYWIKTSGGIRVNTWTTIDFWSTAEKNIQTSKALLQNWQHFVDPQQLYNASCQLSIKGHPIMKGFFFNYTIWFCQNQL